MRKQLILAGLCFLLAGVVRGAVLDRIAVTVGKDVITESEVIQEIRLTDFLNQAPLDLSPAARRAAADRLVDQTLLRNEMQLENFPAPPAAAADQILRQFKQGHFRTAAQYQAALQKYGITPAELMDYLKWQAAALHFTEQRFRPGAPAPAPVPAPAPSKHPSAAPSANQADRTVQHAARTTGSSEAGPSAAADQPLDTWLKQARSQTKVQFHKEAFQ